MKYYVSCTKIYNGGVEVDAKSEEEAFAIAERKIDNNEVDWQLGEITADYVEELDEDYN